MRIAIHDDWSTAAETSLVSAVGLALAEGHEVTALASSSASADQGEVRRWIDRSAMKVELAPAGGPIGAGFDVVVHGARAGAREVGAALGVLAVDAALDPVPPAIEGGSTSALVPVSGFDGVAGLTRYGGTDGDAVIDYYGPGGIEREVTLWFGRLARGIDRVPVRVLVDGDVAATLMLRAERGDRATVVTVPVEGRGPLQPVELRVESGASAADARAGASPARPGVVLLDAGVETAVHRARGRTAPASWYDRFAMVVAPSPMVRAWVAHAWGVHAHVVGLPVEPIRHADAAAAKGPSIVVPGPFVDPKVEASRKQVELVGVFRALADRGHVDGWELRLAGPRATGGEKHLEQVMARAAELEGVRVHLDPGDAEIGRLLSEASIVWSATGIGDDPLREGHRFEPFAHDVVRAMSAGCVPVVIGGGGADGIVQHRTDGVVCASFVQMLLRTEELAHDRALCGRLGAAAVTRAEAFSPAAFASQVRSLLAAAVPAAS